MLSIQAFIDEPVGLGLKMCLMCDKPGAEASSLACDSFACSRSGVLTSSHFVPLVSFSELFHIHHYGGDDDD